MNNLKIYKETKKGKNYIISRIAPISISAIIAVSMLSGCSKKEETNHSLKTTIEALHKEDELSKVDNYLLENSINELDKEFLNAYKNNDIDKCNLIMSDMSALILKAQIADKYNLDYNKIEEFNVLGTILENYNAWVDETEYKGEYGIEFTYNGLTNRIEAEDGLARELCVIEKAGKKYQLVANEKDTEFDYFYIPEAYKLLNEAISNTLESDKIAHTNEFGDDSGYAYDGYFNLEQDPAKEKAIKKALKEYDKQQKRLAKKRK